MVSRPGQLMRLPDWRARLAAEMDRQRRDPFAWGKADCALGLAAGAVKALTGADPCTSWRGSYKTAAGARRALHKRGFSTLADAVAAIAPEIHPDDADVGDIGVIESDGPMKQALCVVDAAGLIVITESGHGRRPREDMQRAFKVG